MKFVKDKSLENYIEELLSINNINMSVSDMFLEVIGNKNIISKKEVEAYKNKFNLLDKDIFLNKYAEYWEIDLNNEEDEDIFNNVITPSIVNSDINKYLNNPYYQLVKQKPFKDKDYELIIDEYEPYELFPLKDISTNLDNYLEENSFSFFSQKFPFLSLNYKGVTWMSVTPNEIETMENSISKVKGNVAVYGLGIGYYAFMISLKEDVKSITIIEKDKKIIELFTKFLLPQFPHKEKIKIVNDDAFNYLKSSNSFDYSFVDLWHNPLDGIESYLKFKKLEKKGEYHYWLESSFYALLRRCFISLIEEQLQGYKEDNYKVEKSYTDKIINIYYYKTKDLTIKNREELKLLLSDSSLLNMLM